MKCFLISDNVDTKLGLRLAGVEGVVVHEKEETRLAVKSASENEEIGVLMITEGLVTLCADLIEEIKRNRKRPLVAVIPDRHGTGRDKDSITRYISESIGLKF